MPAETYTDGQLTKQMTNRAAQGRDMSSTAWWSPLITPAATLIAFMLGVAASWWSDHRKWAREDAVRAITQQREDELRYHKERLEAYNSLLTQAELLMLMQGVETREKPGDTSAITARKAELSAERLGYLRGVAQASQRVQLLATAKTALAASDLADVVTGKDDDIAKYVDAERKFQEAARQELGIALPTLPRPTKR